MPWTAKQTAPAQGAGRGAVGACAAQLPARRPVKQGLSGDEHYLYRGEVANTAIKMAGLEVGLFKDKAEVTHRMDFSDLSDEQLLIRLRDETEALLREKRAAGLLDNGGDEGCSRAGRRTCP